MVNSDVSSAIVRVLVSFYLNVATDDTSSSGATTSSIHKLREIQCSATWEQTQQPVQLREAFKTLHWV